MLCQATIRAQSIWFVYICTYVCYTQCWYVSLMSSVTYACAYLYLLMYIYVYLQPECSLHFHMDTSTDYRRIGVYSRDSAPGIIVAHGE